MNERDGAFAARNMSYCIVGLGLMGGSFAYALRAQTAFPAGHITAIDAKEAPLVSARNAGLIDGGFLPDEEARALLRADVVIVCLPPRQTLEFLARAKPLFKRGAIVTDISGVKNALESGRAAFAGKDSPFDFISGHPMAGSEKEGFAHASASIFKDRNYILIPHPRNKPENLSLLKTLIHALGFKRIIETDAVTHDHKIAFTSQLCHLIAAALVDSAEDTRVTAFGGGSFEDLTRIAMINAPLWTELFLSNKTELLGSLAAFEESLRRLKRMILQEETAPLAGRLNAVREKRILMSGGSNGSPA